MWLLLEESIRSHHPCVTVRQDNEHKDLYPRARVVVYTVLTMTTHLFLLVLSVGLMVVANAVPSPNSGTTTSTTTCPTFFGVTTPKSSNTAAHNLLTDIRGGQVLEPETLEDVEGILLKAASDNQLVVIDFSATWCGPCKMIAPLFQELSEAYMPDGVVFLKIDVDENPDTAAKYAVSAMPTFIFIKGGTVVDRLMGANPARLQELIDQHK